jgi:hypothetical protein
MAMGDSFDVMDLLSEDSQFDSMVEDEEEEEEANEEVEGNSMLNTPIQQENMLISISDINLNVNTKSQRDSLTNTELNLVSGI